MSRRNDKKIDIPNQSFVEDVDLGVYLSHPLRTQKTLKIITFLFLAAFFGAGGIVGIKASYDNATQHSANIAASSLFFAVALLFLVLAFFLVRSKIVVKKVRSVVIGVWAGIRKNIVYLDGKQVYKGKDKNIRVNTHNRTTVIHVYKNTIYFE